MKHKCLVCGNKNCQIFFESKNENLARYGFLKSEESHPLVTGLDQKLAYCDDCHYAWNTVFEPSNIRYDSDQIIEAGYFSRRYLEYQRYSALHLKKLMGFVPETIVEIGAGAGIFIQEFEAKRKVAIEPSDEAKRIDKSVEVYNEYYTEERFNFAADIVVMRQVLEHIKEPLEFLKKIQNSFKKNDKFFLYIEVPNSTLTFRLGRFYDYYYEHCNYFSATTINKLAEKLKMSIVDMSTAMDGELISFLLTAEQKNYTDLKYNLDINRNMIINQLNEKVLNGKRVIAWGASGNGVQILNSLNIDKNIISCVVDSDTNKQGKIIPKTLQKIISPTEAVGYKPDVVLVLTQFHKLEIGASCEKLFKNAEVWYIN